MPENKDNNKKYDWEGLRKFIEYERKDESGDPKVGDTEAPDETPDTEDGGMTLSHFMKLREAIEKASSGKKRRDDGIRVYPESVEADVREMNRRLLDEVRKRDRAPTGKIYRVHIAAMGGPSGKINSEILISDRKHAEEFLKNAVDTCCIPATSVGDSSIRVIIMKSVDDDNFKESTQVYDYRFMEHPPIEAYDGAVAVFVKNWQKSMGMMWIKEEPYW